MTNTFQTMEINCTYNNTPIVNMPIIHILVSKNQVTNIESHNLSLRHSSSPKGQRRNEKYHLQHRIKYSTLGYNLYEINYAYNNDMDREKLYSLNKLKQIATLGNGWNGKNAKAFDKSFLSRATALILSLSHQPEIFPTACDSIQIEYEKDDGSYLEIELTNHDSCNIFEIDSMGQESEFSRPMNVEAINKVVNSFYG